MADPISTSYASIFAAGTAILGALLAILLVAPIWAVEYPPLVDYPNHLARGYILYHYDDVPSFREYYAIDYVSTPSLSLDLFMVALQPILDMRTVCKLFLTLDAAWLYLLGWHFLGRAIHGRPTWLALGAGLFAYHSMFFYGFTNFAFGLGVFLIALAVWYHGRGRGTSAVAAAFAGRPCSRAGVLLLAPGGIHLPGGQRARGDGLGMLCVPGRFRSPRFDTVPISSCRWCFSSGGGGDGSLTEWDFPGKIVGALDPLRGYDRHLDMAFIAAVGVFVALCFLVGADTRRRQHPLRRPGLRGDVPGRPGHSVPGGRPADARFLPAAAACWIAVSFDLNFTRQRSPCSAFFSPSSFFASA